MTTKHTYRLRVESCLVTVMDVHRAIERTYSDPGFLDQFEELRRNLARVDMELVSEGDILTVEKATNALLHEFEVMYRRCGLEEVYQDVKN